SEQRRNNARRPVRRHRARSSVPFHAQTPHCADTAACTAAGAPLPMITGVSNASSLVACNKLLPSGDSKNATNFSAMPGCGAAFGIDNAYTMGCPLIVSVSLGVLPATFTDAFA